MAGVFAAQAGFSTARIGVFVAAAAVGSMALQWPVGHLSDLIGRRRTILLATLASIGAGALALTLSVDSPWLIAVMALLGGFSYPLYSLALSHVIDVLPPGEAVTGSVAVVFLYGVGAIAGPIGASLAMGAIGPDGFFWAVAVVHASIAVFGGYRMVIKPRLPDATIVPYVMVPVRSTFVLRRNGRRRREDQSDS
jgi:MFS family permease